MSRDVLILKQRYERLNYARITLEACERERDCLPCVADALVGREFQKIIKNGVIRNDSERVSDGPCQGIFAKIASMP